LSCEQRKVVVGGRTREGSTWKHSRRKVVVGEEQGKEREGKGRVNLEALEKHFWRGAETAGK
jgi:hypothetical protein